MSTSTCRRCSATSPNDARQRRAADGLGAQRGQRKMSGHLGWGVVGTGDISRSVIGDLRLLDSAPLVGVSSRSLERARDFSAEFGIERAYGSVDELLMDDAVHAVYIGTPHSTHAALAIRALE